MIKSERPDGAVVVNALQEALGELLVAIQENGFRHWIRLYRLNCIRPPWEIKSGNVKRFINFFLSDLSKALLAVLSDNSLEHAQFNTVVPQTDKNGLGGS